VPRPAYTSVVDQFDLEGWSQVWAERRAPPAGGEDLDAIKLMTFAAS
jgi:hypothetical protein